MSANFNLKVEFGSQLASSGQGTVDIFSSAKDHLSGYRLYLREKIPINTDRLPNESPNWPCLDCPLWRDLANEDEKNPTSGCWGPFRPETDALARISVIEYESDRFQNRIQGNCGLEVIPGPSEFHQLNLSKLLASPVKR